ncbi:hypothetical protein B0H65DRAFT_507545 [Neurospora tetraspora]|uniref:CFEM domain-containing protein n=1 Tax=Neurospora tetraspora TaxID=94610 RepID=A0AAE0MSF6_9PEZI|nr:hypothetical protein B0H65DRAFT_507545 [Neurospora tetraspora]
MKFTTIALALFSAVAMAQDCPQTTLMPECGATCIQSAASAIGCTGAGYACQCSKSAEVQNSAAGCVIASCGLNVAPTVVSAAAAICSACT